MADTKQTLTVSSAAPSKKKNGLGEVFNKLSKREQSMISIGLIAVMVMVSVFLIMLPGLAKLDDMLDEADNLDFELNQMQSITGDIASYNQLFSESEEAFKAASKKFFKPMKPETLDERVTGYLIAAGYNPETLSMSPLSVEFLTPFAGTNEGFLNAAIESGSGSENTGAADQGDGTAQGGGTVANDGTAQGGTANENDGAAPPANEDAEAGQTPEGPEGAAAFVYTVNISASGDWSNLYRLLDELKGKNGVEIVSYEYNQAITDSGSVAAGPGTTTGTMANVSNSVSPEYDSISMILKLYVYVEGISASQVYADDTQTQ